MSIPFDDSQRAFIESDVQNIRLLAPAGSGKTLSLLERCRWLDEHQKSAERPRFLIVTFTRAARDELKDRLTKDFLSLQNIVEISTLNKWGLDYIKKFNPKIGNSLIRTKKDRFDVFTYALEHIRVKYPVIEKSPYKPGELAPKVINLMEELKALGFRHNSPDLLTHFYSHSELLKTDFELKSYYEEKIYSKIMPLLDLTAKTEKERPTMFLKFWAEATNFLWSSGRISFEDQKYWALLNLESKGVTNRYHHILVDEFQDINPLDLLLIKTLAKLNHATLTIIGDDDQAIFEWRGSTPNFILYPDKFLGGQFKTYKLSTNYRSPSNLVNVSQNLISNNKKRVSKNVFPALKNQAIIDYPPAYSSHNAFLDDVIELARHAYQTKQPRSLAIVSRKKSQLLPIQILLTSRKIQYYAHEDLNILDSNAFSDFKNILISIAEKTTPKSQQDIIDSLKTCLDYVDEQKWHHKTEKESLIKFLKSKRPRTLADALCVLQDYSKLSVENKYVGPIISLFESKTVFDAVVKIGDLSGMEKHYGKADDDIFYKDPPFSYLAEFSSRYGQNFWAFIHELEDAMSINNLNKQDSDDKFDKNLIIQPVHVMTAHRTKGKEFDTVVLLDVNDGIWPLKSEDIEQERRLFYVAITRPKKKLVLLTVKSIGSKSVQVSPFIAEMGLNGSNGKILPITTKKTYQVLNRSEHNIPVNPNLKERSSKVSVPQFALSKPNASKEHAREIFGRVCKELKSSPGEWIDWDIFRSKLLELSPEFTVGGSQKLKFKSVVNTYSSVIEHRYHERFSNKVFVRVNGAEQVVTSKEKSKQSLKKRGSMSSVIKDPIVSTLQEICPDGKRVPLKKFREHLYRLHPNFDDNLRLYSFNLEDALQECSGAIDFSRKNSTIGLKDK